MNFIHLDSIKPYFSINSATSPYNNVNVQDMKETQNLEFVKYNVKDFGHKRIDQVEFALV